MAGCTVRSLSEPGAASPWWANRQNHTGTRLSWGTLVTPGIVIEIELLLPSARSSDVQRAIAVERSLYERSRNDLNIAMSDLVRGICKGGGCAWEATAPDVSLVLNPARVNYDPLGPGFDEQVICRCELGWGHAGEEIEGRVAVESKNKVFSTKMMSCNTKVDRTNKSAFIGFYFESAERHFRILFQRVGFLISVAFSPLVPWCSISAYKSRREREREKERAAFVYIQGHQLTS